MSPAKKKKIRLEIEVLEKEYKKLTGGKLKPNAFEQLLESGKDEKALLEVERLKFVVALKQVEKKKK